MGAIDPAAMLGGLIEAKNIIKVNEILMYSAALKDTNILLQMFQLGCAS